MSDKKSKIYEDHSKFLDENFTKEEMTKLNRVQPLESFNEEIREILKACYDHPDSRIKRLGSILNAIYTQYNTVFMLSVRILRELTPLDIANHGLKSCEGADYNWIIHQCLSLGIFERIRDQVGKKASLFRLVHPRYLDPLYRFVGKEICEAKADKNIEFWDNTNTEGASIKKDDKPLTEAEKRIKERADDILRRSKT